MKILSELKPNPKNPRKIDESKLSILKKTLDAFGDLSGFVVNVYSGKLISGHQRQKALPANSEIHIEKRYDEPTKKGTVAEGYIDVDGERFKYREVNFSPETEQAAMIAANKSGGEWDKSLLAENLLWLDSKGWDTELAGWSREEFESLCAPDFKPGTEDEQGKLDEKKLNYLKCPSCGDVFESQQGKIKD